ncbi:MAG: cation transporter [Chthoniobacterales bacterium]|nr:cation transporter [Chthoniobacterales bacterium]
METEAETPRGQRLALLSLLVAAVAVLGCAVAALTSDCLTVRADLLNAFLDFSGDVVVLGAMRMATNRRWAVLDYGPGKIENLGSLVVGVVMFLGLAGLGVQVVQAVYNPEPVIGVGVRIGLFVATAFCIADVWIWWQVRQESRRSPSQLLDTFRRATLNSALVGVMVCFTLSVALVFQEAWVPYLDIFTALVLGGFAVHHARKIVSHSFRDLMDQAIAEPLQVIINQHLVRNFECYLNLDGVRSRCSGSTIFIDIFLGFHPQQSIREIQATVDKLRAGLEQDIPSAKVTVIPRSHEVADTSA